MGQQVKGMFDGPLVPLTLRIALPILLSNFLQLFYVIADTFFIARIDPGSTALLSGTGLMFPVFFLCMSLGMSINVGMSSLVGRVIGEKNTEAAGNIMASGLVLSLAIAVPTLLFGYAFGDFIVRSLAGNRLSDEALGYAMSFFRYLLPGLGILFIVHGISGVLQGEGLTGKMARAMIISTLCNVILDPLFIFGLKMGVAGAALATSVSICVSAAYIAAIFIRKQTTIPFSIKITKARWTIMREIIRVGFPHFLSMASLSISFMIFNKIVSTIGQTAMNGWTLAGRMDQIVLIPSFAVAGATIPIIAQNYGRGLLERVRAAYVRTIAVALAMVGLAALVYNITAPWLFSAFTNVPEVIEIAVSQVRYTSWSFIGVAAAIISASAFQATGRPLPALMLTVFRIGIIAVPLSLLLVFRFNMGIAGVWIGLAVGNAFMLPAACIAAWHHLKNLQIRRSI